MARRFCIGHAHSWPVRWNCPVEVFGRTIQPGQLIHADKHGFLVVPQEDEQRLLDAALFVDANECKTVIAAATPATAKKGTFSTTARRLRRLSGQKSIRRNSTGSIVVVGLAMSANTYNNMQAT